MEAIEVSTAMVRSDYFQTDYLKEDYFTDVDGDEHDWILLKTGDEDAFRFDTKLTRLAYLPAANFLKAEFLDMEDDNQSIVYIPHRAVKWMNQFGDELEG